MHALERREEVLKKNKALIFVNFCISGVVCKLGWFLKHKKFVFFSGTLI